MCSEVLAQIERALHQGLITSTSPAVVAHIATCSTCRGALLGLAVSLGLVSLHPGDCNCADCQANLAAFIDVERADPAAASSAYPDLWWHLWTCGICADTYRLTYLLLASAASGEVPPLPDSA